MAHRYNKRTESYPNTVSPSHVAAGTLTCMSGNGQQDTQPRVPHSPEENPNILVYKKMEGMIERMQNENTGVPVRTVKSFMTKVPSVFTGQDLVNWMMRNLDVDETTEAIHLASLMSSHGYFFPIDDHVLCVKNDNTYYRFQTPCFWPSRCGEPENTDYAVYLCKRTMQNKQRLELADYEAENLARLQKMFSRKWEFIFMQAEAQAKVDKKRDKLERKVLDSQERAFWDVHRPVPGCVNTTEVDIKKACKMNRHSKLARHNYAVPGGRISPSVSEAELNNPCDTLRHEISVLRRKIEKRRVKISKVAEYFMAYSEQYAEFDSFIITADPANPWVADSLEFWELEKAIKFGGRCCCCRQQDVAVVDSNIIHQNCWKMCTIFFAIDTIKDRILTSEWNPRDISQKRVKKWSFSVEELLRDPAGKDHFSKFLDKEFSGENLKFWLACQELRGVTLREVPIRVQEIFNEFLAPGCHNPINVDSRVAEAVRAQVAAQPGRFCFEESEDHIFQLMRCDSYNRYIRSDMYKEFLSGTRKKLLRSIIPKLPSLNLGGQ